MRIAILGIRGVPANYGGFETFAEELGARLVERGHAVTVYGRDRYVARTPTTYRGIRLVRLPAPRSKYLETVVHSLFAAIHAIGGHDDIVYICNSANVPAAILLRLAGRRVVLNVDGLEWKRTKWNGLGRAYYRACEWVAARLPVHVVTDAAVIADHYATAHGRRIPWFPYGADLAPTPDDGTLARLGLEPRRYVLYVSRLEPENNADVVIDAWSRVTSDLPLVVVGDAPYASVVHRGTPRDDRSAGPLRRSDLRDRLSGPPVACDGLRPGDRGRRARTRRSSKRWASGPRSSPTTFPSIVRCSATRDLLRGRRGPGDRPGRRARRSGAAGGDARGGSRAGRGRRSAGTPSPTPTRRGSASSSARAPPADPVLSADVEDRPHHRDHRPGRLVPRRAPARPRAIASSG